MKHYTENRTHGQSNETPTHLHSTCGDGPKNIVYSQNGNFTYNSSMLDISEITDYLYIAAWPKGKYADEVSVRDIRLVINMIWLKPAVEYTKDPFRMVTYRTFDNPFFRISVDILMNGVKEALPIIENGASVMTYCREGRHRSVAMASCILIGCGYSADDAMNLISAHREVADPRAAHIESQILKFEEAWKKESK